MGGPGGEDGCPPVGFQLVFLPPDFIKSLLEDPSFPRSELSFEFFVCVFVTNAFLNGWVVGPAHNHLGVYPFQLSGSLPIYFGPGSLAFAYPSTSCKAAGSDFGPPRVFDFPGTYHI